MTKNEFREKLNAAYTHEINKYRNFDYVASSLHSFANENGQLSNTDMMMFALVKSCEINHAVLQNIFENVLEFDD